ncbi:MAG: DNA primase [Carboxydocellales bacterium]
MIELGGLIAQEVIERVRAASDIVEVVREFVPLKKMGRNYFGICPFHAEDSPSFSVSAEKQIFYCFGCNAGGNVYKFLMLKEGIVFPEAVRRIAERVGITVPSAEKDPQTIKAEQKRHRAYEANELAMKYYHFLLKKELGQSGQAYLHKRGLTAEIIEQFQIGFAPQNWDSLLKFLTSRGYREKELAELGLLAAHHRENKDTSFYDQFRNRVIFPIWNHYNRVVGFGGRVMDQSLPKYLNSPETEIFSKSNNLYGMNFALNSIRDLNQAIVMEGYLDVITSHQFGITNTVAALGTAMTPEHAKQLLRYTPNVIMAFDADQAGIKATMRGMDILQAQGCHVQVVAIPDGKDPDEFIRKNGSEAFKKLLTEQAMSLVEFKMIQSAEKYDLTSVTGKTSALAEVLPNLAKVHNAVEREEYLRILGQELNLSWETILGELRKYRVEQQKSRQNRDKYVKYRNNISDMGSAVIGKPVIKLDGLKKAEYTLLRLILENKQNLEYVENNLGLAAFRDPQLRQIAEIYREQVQAGGGCFPSDLYPLLPEEELSSILSRVLMMEIPLNNSQQTLTGCIKAIRGAGAEDRKSHLLKELAEAEKVGDWQLVAQLMGEYNQLCK